MRYIWLLLIPLAGCLGAGGSADVGSDRHWDAAHDLARDWHPEANLVLALAVESPTADADARLPPELRVMMTRADDAPGDGRAPAWLYAFRAPSEDAPYSVVVAADGSTLHKGFMDTSTELLQVPRDALPAQPISSVEAADAIHASSFGPTWKAAPEQGMMALRDEGTAQWWMSRGSEGGPFVLLAVDAQNATVQDASLFAFGLAREYGSEGGTLSTVQTTRNHVAHLGFPGHESLALALQIDDALPAHRVEAIMTGPSGDVLEVSLTGAGTATATTSDPVAGEWTIEVRLADGVRSDYQLSWCTDGFADISMDNVPACEALSED